jgi:hypothetical protein
MIDEEAIIGTENNLKFDDEIKAEINLIKNLGDDKKGYPLVAENLTKVYEDNKKSGKKSLNNLNLLLKNNEIFGLLGFFI